MNTAEQSETDKQTTIARRDVWARVMNLPCEASVDICIPHFTVADLLAVRPGSVLNTKHREHAHVPLIVNRQTVAWGEFEVVEDNLALRLVDLAPGDAPPTGVRQ
jgi:flagellar motor switch/type III secretory pathway protein FliN